MKKNKLSKKANLDYLSGFNDALMLIICAEKCFSWEEALKEFDFSASNLSKCAITQKNIEEVRLILDTGLVDE